MIKSIVLISAEPLDVVVIDWKLLTYRRRVKIIRHYIAFGYLCIVVKILHRRDGSEYRKVSYGPNEKGRLVIFKHYREYIW